MFDHRFAAVAAFFGCALCGALALPSPAHAVIDPPPAGATVIDFDDVSANCSFAGSTALRNQYAAQQILFDAPSNDGGAVLDQCSNFTVTGHSAPNFLAFNDGSVLSDSGIPRLPQTVLFTQPAYHVQFNAASFEGGLLTAEVFDSGDNSIGTLSQALGTAMQTFTLAVPDIVRLEISGPQGIVIMDDFAFLAPCGNGILDVGEDCDDDNVASGDCCSPTCEFEPFGSSCDDGNICTDDICNGSGTCVTTPSTTFPCDDDLFCTTDGECQGGTCVPFGLTDCNDNDVCTEDSCNEDTDSCDFDPEPVAADACHNAAGGKLIIKSSAEAGGDKLGWLWKKGEGFAQAALGDPLGATTYRLCIYDQTSPSSYDGITLDIAASASLWTSKDPKGLVYKDPDGSSDGVTKAKIKTGDDGKTLIKLGASGVNLSLPPPLGESAYFAQDPQVVVQLHNSNGTCWHSDFVEADMLKNDGKGFKAKK